MYCTAPQIIVHYHTLLHIVTHTAHCCACLKKIFRWISDFLGASNVYNKCHTSPTTKNRSKNTKCSLRYMQSKRNGRWNSHAYYTYYYTEHDVCMIYVWYLCVLWCSVVFCGVLWCSVVFCGVLWCSVVFCGVLWCSVMFCDIFKCCVYVCVCVCVYVYVYVYLPHISVYTQWYQQLPVNDYTHALQNIYKNLKIVMVLGTNSCGKVTYTIYRLYRASTHFEYGNSPCRLVTIFFIRLSTYINDI